MRDAWWAHLSKVLRPALASSQFVPHELDDTGKWFIHPNPNDFHLDKNMKLYSQGWKNNFQRTSQKSADGNFVYFPTRTNKNKTIILCSYYNSFGFSLIYLIFSDFFLNSPLHGKSFCFVFWIFSTKFRRLSFNCHVTMILTSPSYYLFISDYIPSWHLLFSKFKERDFRRNSRRNPVE